MRTEEAMIGVTGTEIVIGQCVGTVAFLGSPAVKIGNLGEREERIRLRVFLGEGVELANGARNVVQVCLVKVPGAQRLQGADGDRIAGGALAIGVKQAGSARTANADPIAAGQK